MAAFLPAFALFPFLVTAVAGEEACPAGASCTTVDQEGNASLQLLQVGFSMQPGTGEPGPAPGSSALSLDATRGTNQCEDPGNGETRVWYLCSGQKEPAPTEAEQALGVTVGSEMCCTEEVNFDCLCCMDFTKPLDFNRCGTMSLSAAQKAPGSPGAMKDDAPKAAQNSSIVVICTEERAMERMATESAPNSTVSLPVQCVPREFTLEELRGSGAGNATGDAPQPGQILFDERILFLLQQGLPNQAIPTCKGAVPGTCPTGTPKAGQKPNSAGEATLSKLEDKSLLEEEDEHVLGWGGSLMTSGSFTMMAPGGA